MIKFTLPLPPPVNNLYANRRQGGRAATAEYRAWQKNAGWHVLSQHPGHVDGPYALTLSLPVRTPGDIDNRLKACLDLLVKLGVTPDDRQASRVTAQRVAGLSDALVEVEAA